MLSQGLQQRVAHKKTKEEEKGREELEKLEFSETEKLLGKLAKNEKEIKDFLWKHFAMDMAKEFMYGMAIGMLAGIIISRLFFRC